MHFELITFLINTDFMNRKYKVGHKPKENIINKINCVISFHLTFKSKRILIIKCSCFIIILRQFQNLMKCKIHDQNSCSTGCQVFSWFLINTPEVLIKKRVFLVYHLIILKHYWYLPFINILHIKRKILYFFRY